MQYPRPALPAAPAAQIDRHHRGLGCPVRRTSRLSQMHLCGSDCAWDSDIRAQTSNYTSSMDMKAGPLQAQVLYMVPPAAPAARLVPDRRRRRPVVARSCKSVDLHEHARPPALSSSPPVVYYWAAGECISTVACRVKRIDVSVTWVPKANMAFRVPIVAPRLDE